MMDLFYAYIDPGAGSLVLQAFIAALVSVPFLLRASIKRGWRRLRGRRGDEPRAD